jgi:hypothetical protein
MNPGQRRLVSWVLIIGGPVTGLVWANQYGVGLFRPLVWTIATVTGGLYLRAGGGSET